MWAILGGLGAAAAWAAGTACAARASRMVAAESLLAGVMAVGFLVSAPAAAISGLPSGLGAGSVAWLVVSGVGNVIGLLLAYGAYRIGAVGVVAPVTSTEGAVAALIAVAAGERLAPGAGAMLGVIAVGVALAAASPRGLDRTRAVELEAVLLACGAAVSFGCSLYATGRVGQEIGIAWAALPPRVVGVAAIALPLALTGRLRLTRAVLPLVVADGLCEVAGFASYAFGARHGLAVAAVLASQFAAIAAVLGYVLFRERLGRLQVLGVAAIVVGVSVLGALRG